MTDDTNQGDEAEERTAYHAPESRVVHHDRDCYHLDNANDVEQLDEDEAESYRTCRQCWYNDLSLQEKSERKRRSRRKSTRTVTVKYRW